MQNKDRFISEDEATKAWSLEVNGGKGKSSDDLSLLKWLFKEYDTQSTSEKRIKPGDLFYAEHGTSISAVRTNDEKRTVIFGIDRVRYFDNWKAETEYSEECACLIDSLCEYLNRNGKIATPETLITKNSYLEKDCERLRRERDTLRSENDFIIHDVEEKLKKSDMACTAWMNQSKETHEKLAKVEEELFDVKRAYDELKGDYLVSEERLKKFKDMELSLATKENYEREIRTLEQQRKDKDAKIVELSENFELVKTERDKLRLMYGEKLEILAEAWKNAELFERERNEARAKLEEAEKQLERMRKGRDERQKECDEEREKVRKLSKRVEELEASKDSALNNLNGEVPNVAEIIKERDELKFKMDQIKRLV